MVLDVKAGDVVRSDEGHVSLPFVAVFRVDQFYRRGRGPVSYTHLDVYKRQALGHTRAELRRLFDVELSVALPRGHSGKLYLRRHPPRALSLIHI